MSPKAERILDIAGLRTTAVGSPDAPLTLVLLHGYAMRPSDLAPFAHSLGVPAFFLFPQGPLSSPGGGHAWWGVDEEARSAAIAAGPRDLANEYPPGLPAARLQLERFLDAVAPRHTVFQVGYRNRFRHPNTQVLARYRARQSALLRSDLDGAVRFETLGAALRVCTYRAARRRYWMD